MQACYKGKKRGVHDGGGLCSPGRWRVGARNFPETAHFCEIREIIRKFFKGWLSQERGQETFWQMAAGRLTGSPFGKFVDGCRREVDVKLASLGCEVTRQVTDQITEIHYRRRLESCGGPRPLVPHPPGGNGGGPGCGRGDAPGACGLRSQGEVESRRGGRPLQGGLVRELRLGGGQHGGHSAEVEEDIERGHVIRMDKQAAVEKFGGRLAVASLGAVPKELGSSKVRIIHDATHEVMINHRIRVRDRMRFSGGGDGQADEGGQAANPAVRLLMKYDVSRAHKLVPVKEQDWPLMAFSLERPEEVFMHTVGAFGFGSAAYWWQRVAATVTRLAHYMSAGAYELYHLLFADDGLLGAPWCGLLEADPLLVLRDGRGGGADHLEEGCWRGQAGLDRLRGRHSALPQGHRGQQGSVGSRLDKGGQGRGQHPGEPDEISAGAAFVRGGRAGAGTPLPGSDLRASAGRFSSGADGGADRVGVHQSGDHSASYATAVAKEGGRTLPGGCQGGGRSGGGRRMGVLRRPPHRGGPVVLAEADTEDSPVGLREGRAVPRDSLELIATTIAVCIFGPGSQWRDSVGELVVQGFTDSLVNTHVIDHYMSTAFPLSVVLMELAVQLGELGTTLHSARVDASGAERRSGRAYQPGLHPFQPRPEGAVGAGRVGLQDNSEDHGGGHSAGLGDQAREG